MEIDGEKTTVMIQKSVCVRCGSTGNIPNKHKCCTGCQCSDAKRCDYCGGSGEQVSYIGRVDNGTGTGIAFSEETLVVEVHRWARRPTLADFGL